jgi:hypothetical protein
MTILETIKKNKNKILTIVLIIVVIAVFTIIIYYGFFNKKPDNNDKSNNDILYQTMLPEKKNIDNILNDNNIKKNNLSIDEILYNYDESYYTTPIPTSIPKYIPVQNIKTTLPPQTTTMIPYLYAFKTHTFTNAGAVGSIGPTLEQVRAAYNTVWKTEYLNMMNNDGIQLWTVPISGYYQINAVGAGGGGSNIYGKGRDVEIITYLKINEVIQILVGQKGNVSTNNQGSGGGGTFVFKDNKKPIIIAGGGGGRGSNNEDINSNAIFSINGNNGAGDMLDVNTYYGDGGNYGNGGGQSAFAGGGGGIINNGGSNSKVLGGFSFINGGRGKTNDIGSGGFGGGGNCIDDFGGGGGGGYSGGGGGGKDNELGWLGGGGGGSGQSGINYSNLISIPNNTQNMINYRGKSDIFSIVITGIINNSSIWGTNIYTDNSDIIKAAMHSGIIKDGETKKVYIEMLPRQESYSGSNKNSITSSSFGSYDGSYKFISSPTKILNSNIGDATPLIDYGARNKDHGRVIITFISITLPKQQEDNFTKMQKKIILDTEIYHILEKIKNKQEIKKQKEFEKDIQNNLNIFEQERKTILNDEQKRIEQLKNWELGVSEQEKLQSEIKDGIEKRKVLEKEILKLREEFGYERSTRLFLEDLAQKAKAAAAEAERLALEAAEKAAVETARLARIAYEELKLKEAAEETARLAEIAAKETARLAQEAAKETARLAAEAAEKLRLEEAAKKAAALAAEAAEKLRLEEAAKKAAAAAAEAAEKLRLDEAAKIAAAAAAEAAEKLRLEEAAKKAAAAAAAAAEKLRSEQTAREAARLAEIAAREVAEKLRLEEAARVAAEKLRLDEAARLAKNAASTVGGWLKKGWR